MILSFTKLLQNLYKTIYFLQKSPISYKTNIYVNKNKQKNERFIYLKDFNILNKNKKADALIIILRYSLSVGYLLTFSFLVLTIKKWNILII